MRPLFLATILGVLGTAFACSSQPPVASPATTPEVVPFETDNDFKATPRTARVARKIAMTEISSLGVGLKILGTAHGGDPRDIEKEIAAVGGTHYVPIDLSGPASESGVVVHPTGTWADTPSSACARAPTTDGARPPCAPRNGRNGWVISDGDASSTKVPRHWLVFAVPVEQWDALADPLRPSPAPP